MGPKAIVAALLLFAAAMLALPDASVAALAPCDMLIEPDEAYAGQTGLVVNAPDISFGIPMTLTLTREDGSQRSETISSSPRMPFHVTEADIGRATLTVTGGGCHVVAPVRILPPLPPEPTAEPGSCVVSAAGFTDRLPDARIFFLVGEGFVPNAEVSVTFSEDMRYAFQPETFRQWTTTTTAEGFWSGQFTPVSDSLARVDVVAVVAGTDCRREMSVTLPTLPDTAMASAPDALPPAPGSLAVYFLAAVAVVLACLAAFRRVRA